ncbi:MAG TPA: riboflavin synthase [Solirubrobacteraceae bacterium]|nr:riboflavin synthase [Solirubrobacteraceae bacterium]
MFTGLIGDLGEVSALRRDSAGATLEVRTRLAGELVPGDSVAVNGVCLTAAGVRGDSFSAQAMGETLERSTLGSLQAGSRVNLELPLRAGDRLGGHIVQGHVDGTAVVTEARPDGFARVLSLRVDPALARYLVLKGSVALDGVSLTVSALAGDGFEVSLIPETLARTNLSQLGPGAAVNVEVDVLAKHVERLISARAPQLSEAGA